MNTPRLLVVLLAVAVLAGCVPESRMVQPAKAGTYGFVVVETPHADLRLLVTNAVAPHLTVLDAPAVRDRGVANQTLILQVNGNRGLWHCNATGTFLDLVTREPVAQMRAKRGLLYMGQDAALDDILELANKEAALLSSKPAAP